MDVMGGGGGGGGGIIINPGGQAQHDWTRFANWLPAIELCCNVAAG